MDHAEHRPPRHLPAMPETHPTPDPIPIRPRLRRQSLNVRELWTRKTRTTGSRNVLPRLLTRIQDMWLTDLREPPKESHVGSRNEHRASRISSKRSVTHNLQSIRSVNVKTG